MDTITVKNKHLGIIILLSFIVYFNTLFNDYALDDSMVVTRNIYTQKGFSGIKEIFTTDSFTGFFGVQKNLVSGGRYRPLSIATFAIEYQFFGKSPFVCHLVNLLLYAFTGIIIYLIFLRILPKPKEEHWLLSVPFVTALLFMAHPIHTEVIANIKGRDEILAFLGAISTLLVIILYFETKKPLLLVFGFVIFFLGLLSKENTATYIFIIPLTLYVFSKKPKFKEILIPSLVPVIALLIFVFVRSFFIAGPPDIPDDIMNNSFAGMTKGETYGTIFFTLWKYIRLLIFPHPLTYDYYPYHIPKINISDSRGILPFLLYSVLLVYMFIGLRKRSIWAYGIALYLIPLFIVSNIVFPIGSFMNERFAYFSSLGFCLVAAQYICVVLPGEKTKKKNKSYTIALSVLAVVIALYCLKTITRNMDWKNNYVLFTHDVNISKNSAKSNTTAGLMFYNDAVVLKNERKVIGEQIMKEGGQNDSLKKEFAEKEKQEKEFLRKSIYHLQRAVQIYPRYVDALMLLGTAHFEYDQDVDSSMMYYSQLLYYAPKYYKGMIGNAIIFSNTVADRNKKLEICKYFYKFDKNLPELNYQLGSIYGKNFNMIDSSVYYLKRAIELKPDYVMAMKDLGTAYSIKKEYNKALEMFLKAAGLTPQDIELHKYVMFCYVKLGQQQKADEYLAEIKQKHNIK